MGKSFVGEVRTLKARIEEAEVNKGVLRLELMLLLVESRPKLLVWRDEYDSWDELLRKEKPCSVSAFYRFETALKLMPLEDVQRFGVAAVGTITMTPTAYRSKLIKAVRRWHKDRKVKPNHATVARYVWDKRRQLAPEQEFVSRGRLVRYIDSLKSQLKNAGLKPKPLSKVK